MKSYTIPIPDDVLNYLQRLDYEVSTTAFLIDYMFNNHKNDTDLSLFESAPFIEYQKKLQAARYEYDRAKSGLTKTLIPLIDQQEGRTGVKFNWSVNDFTIPEALITILDDEKKV